MQSNQVHQTERARATELNCLYLAQQAVKGGGSCDIDINIPQSSVE